MSDLQKTCAALLAAFAGTAELGDRLMAESRALQGRAAAVAEGARRSRNPHAGHAAAAALQEAARCCEAAARGIRAAEGSARLFVRRTVGGTYGSGDAVGNDAAAWAGTWAGPGFSSPKVAAFWDTGRVTPAGRAFFSHSDSLRLDALTLQRFPGEYTIDMHGNPHAVGVGRVSLDARELAELIRADPRWGGQPVRLFSCDTGHGRDPFGASLARELGVRVTAPDGIPLHSHTHRGYAICGARWERVGRTWERVPDLTREGRWRTFDP